MLFTGSKVEAKMLLLKNVKYLSFLITERVSVEDNNEIHYRSSRSTGACSEALLRYTCNTSIFI